MVYQILKPVTFSISSNYQTDRRTGILILTSNRVGTFDEAFKSRIQLNLRYKNLEKTQRHKIWENFIKRLETLEQSREVDQEPGAIQQQSHNFGVDARGIRVHLDDLADEKLNGREIRNAISTARQLAMYRRESLGYEHLRSVINEASKFDEYIKELHRNFSADEIAKDKMER